MECLKYLSSIAVGASRRAWLRSDRRASCFDDLAVGVPAEDRGSAFDVGAVSVSHGSASRLTVTDDQFWQQRSSAVADVARPPTSFGSSLTASYFNAAAATTSSPGCRDEVRWRWKYCG